jgi:hypothetical protein
MTSVYSAIRTCGALDELSSQLSEFNEDLQTSGVNFISKLFDVLSHKLKEFANHEKKKKLAKSESREQLEELSNCLSEQNVPYFNSFKKKRKLQLEIKDLYSQKDALEA